MQKVSKRQSVSKLPEECIALATFASVKAILVGGIRSLREHTGCQETGGTSTTDVTNRCTVGLGDVRFLLLSSLPFYYSTTIDGILVANRVRGDSQCWLLLRLLRESSSSYYGREALGLSGTPADDVEKKALQAPFPTLSTSGMEDQLGQNHYRNELDG